MELQERILAARSPATAPLTRIALLLPLTGPQRQAAIAIQDGFLAAHLGRSGGVGRGQPALHIYDTGALGAREAYIAARDDGAEFIVGPLLKPELDAIMDSARVNSDTGIEHAGERSVRGQSLPIRAGARR